MLIIDEIKASKDTLNPSNYFISLNGLKILSTLNILSVFNSFDLIKIERN